MSEKPISPLRRRMIEDMTVRNFVGHSSRKALGGVVKYLAKPWT
jgi:hypothetical protein